MRERGLVKGNQTAVGRRHNLSRFMHIEASISCLNNAHLHLKLWTPDIEGYLAHKKPPLSRTLQ